MTEKLYYESPYISEFNAKVLFCEEKNGRFLTVLDKTAFFPTGGGQDCDKGTLDGKDVTDVFEKDGLIYHETADRFENGSEISGKIDFDRRLSFMQNHSGEHILSGTVHKMLGYNNVGFHMGSEFVTVDFDGPMTDEQIIEAEKRTNDIIFSNIHIKTYFPSTEELLRIDYRSKKELSGDIRIVEIPSVDICACCGTHVENTGEIGLLKVVEHMNYKGGVRLFILSGKRALEDYSAKNSELYRIGVMLSKKTSEAANGVEKLLEELSLKRYENSVLWKKYAEKTAESIKETDGVSVFCENGADNDALRLIAVAASKKCCAAVALSQDKDGITRYAISSVKTDSRILNKTLCGAFSGRGGGKAELCQGTLHGNAAEIADFIHTNT